MMPLRDYLSASEVVIRKYWPGLLRSEEAIGFVAGRMMEADAAYDPSRGASPSTWRTWVARRAIREHLGARLREGRGPVVATVDPVDPSQEDPGDAMCRWEDQDEEMRRMNAMLDSLPPVQRACVTLHHLCGLRPFEVARVLGVSRQVACRRIDRGMASLRRAAGTEAS